MRKYIYIIIVIIVSNTVYSQGFSSSLKIDWVKYEMNAYVNEGTSTSKPIYSFEKVSKYTQSINIMGGYDFRIHKFNDDLSIGLNLNIGVGIFSLSMGSFSDYEMLRKGISLTLPEYLMFYYGHNATKESEMKNGFAIGIGYEYTKTYLTYQSPSIAIEYSRGSSILRLSYNILHTKLYEDYRTYETSTLIEGFKIKNISLSFIFLIGR